MIRHPEILLLMWVLARRLVYLVPCYQNHHWETKSCNFFIMNSQECCLFQFGTTCTSKSVAALLKRGQGWLDLEYIVLNVFWIDFEELLKCLRKLNKAVFDGLSWSKCHPTQSMCHGCVSKMFFKNPNLFLHPSNLSLGTTESDKFVKFYYLFIPTANLYTN